MIKIILLGIVSIVSFFSLFYKGDCYQTLAGETKQKRYEYKASTCYLMAVIAGLSIPIIGGVFIL